MLVSVSDYQDTLITLRGENTLVVDTETTGLDTWGQDILIGIAVLAPSTGESYYFPFRHPAGNLPTGTLRPLIILLAERGMLIGHNLKYDVHMLRKEGFPLQAPARWGDTMLLAHLLDENEPSFKLEDLGTRYVSPVAGEAEKRLEEALREAGYRGKGSLWRLDPETVAPYAEQDVRLTWALWCRLGKAAQAKGLSELAAGVFEYEAIVSRMEQEGIALDVPLIEEYHAEAETMAGIIEGALIQEIGQPDWLVDKRGRPVEFNPASAVQVCRWLGIPSSAHKILEEKARAGDTRAQQLIAYRGWHKMMTSYYNVYLEKRDENDWLHPDFLLHGTVTGRLACRNPNLQAVARKEHEWSKVKDVFVARSGYAFVQADYSQAEMRLACHYSKEKAMTAIIESGVNMHDQTSRDLGIPRFAAKQINFSVVYGIGARTLSKTLGTTEETAKAYLTKYHQQYPGFKRLYYATQRVGEQQGFIRLFTGRVRHFNNRGGIAPTHKASSNLIQGGVGEIVRIAQTRLHKELAPEGVRQILQVHDSVLFEVPEADLSRQIPRIREIMEDFPFVPRMLVDIQTGKRWGRLENA